MSGEMIDGPTIPQLAVKLGIPRRTMFRRLLKMHAHDRDKNPDFQPWLYRYQQGSWRVNMTRLRRGHPELFSVASNEELDARLKRVERQVETLDSGHRALVQRVREVARNVATPGPK